MTVELGVRRRLPCGADCQERGVHFRVWAPARQQVEVVLENHGLRAFALEPERNGYFSALVPDARPGTLYRYRLDGTDRFPDLASRFQPEGVHGPSQVIDPDAFRWTDDEWRGPDKDRAVVYELHVGTFTREGTWEAAARELAELRRAGITVIEVMPVADFAGRFGWGYDGVALYAPTRLYGHPDDFRRFVDRAHAEGLAVILDVVYNHVGPDGAYFRSYAPAFFTKRYENDWGESLNFDGKDAGPVRDFFVANAGYWIDEFHIDGLRLDATDNIQDASPTHVIAELTARARERAGGRRTLIVAENERQDVTLVQPAARGGCGVDALWNDDFHHAASVALTGRREAYYTDYFGTPQELISALKRGYLYQGQYYSWQRRRRGSPTADLTSDAFVAYIQNHDQVANSANGLRVHQLSSPGRVRAMTAVLLLGPAIPMLFQGQEFGASAPFLFFADHKPDLAESVRSGRRQFLSQFRSIATPEAQARLADPGDPATFERCKLDFAERERHRATYELHRDLLALRHDDPVFSRRPARPVDGAVLGASAFVVRFFADDHAQDRLVLVNLGRDLTLGSVPEPLLAPSAGCRWRLLWSSEDPRYGGSGTPEVDTEDGWRIPGEAAVVLAC
jgi:maltooligosyltrehalose trehalohydrolase